MQPQPRLYSIGGELRWPPSGLYRRVDWYEFAFFREGFCCVDLEISQTLNVVKSCVGNP